MPLSLYGGEKGREEQLAKSSSLSSVDEEVEEDEEDDEDDEESDELVELDESESLPESSEVVVEVEVEVELRQRYPILFEHLPYLQYGYSPLHSILLPRLFRLQWRAVVHERHMALP
ncbi:unnamed protein product [Chrysodeixis includens]|uniref:Uncharacterized protein n=1 Tax=Chrysodeixis includens TaxID=689277 RepID=A0A9N8KUA4_CHRIL|nr:unnamed protein product [Chrysodeixis includens]